MANTEDQIADIRERVAVIETQVTYLRRAFEAHNEQEKKGGNVVIPVAAVVVVLEIVKAVIERLG